MQTYVCTNCGATQTRPTLPLRCPGCGQQRIGLFKPQAPAPAAQTPAAQSPAAPASAAQTPAGIAAPAAQPARAPVAKPVVEPRRAPLRPVERPKAAGGIAPPPLPKAAAAAQPVARKSAPRHPAASQRPPGEPGAIAWRWPERLPGQDDSYLPIRNCPALGSKKQLYAALGRHLVALAEEPDAVHLVWKYSTGGHIPGSPVLGPDLRIRVHAGDGRLHCVTEDGQSAWPAVPVGEPLGWASPLVDAAGNTWICAYGGGLLRVDGSAAGIGAPFFRSRQRFDCSGLIQGGVLYVGGEDGFVRAIDLTGGKGKNRWRVADDRGKTEWFVNSAPARSPTGALVVAGRDEYLYAFDAEGQAVGKLHIRGQMLGSPVIDSSGDIYVGVSLLERGHEARGKLVCVSHDVRQVRWEYPADGAVESTAVLGDDGTIYFGDNAGVVHAVRSDGRGAWKEPVGAAVRSAGCISTGGRVVFGLDDGTLVALASTSGGLAGGGWPKYLAGTANRTE